MAANESRAREAFARKEYKLVVEIFQQTINPTESLMETTGRAYAALASELIFDGGTSRGGLKATVLERAIGYCANGSRLARKELSVWNTWGATLKILADTKGGEEAAALLRESIDKYDAALALSSKHWIHGNKGAALAALALADDEGSIFWHETLNAARQQYETALSIAPEYPSALSGIGLVYQKISVFEPEESAGQLLDDACRMLEKATKLQSKNSVAWERLVECYLAKSDRSSSDDRKKAALASAVETAGNGLVAHPNNATLLKGKETAAQQLSELLNGPGAVSPVASTVTSSPAAEDTKAQSQVVE